MAERRRETARIEAVAPALCRARNIDPDHQGEPYPPGPVRRMFRQQAAEFIAMHDAAADAGDDV